MRFRLSEEMSDGFDRSLLAAGEMVRVALTGPFLTGLGIAIEELSDEDLQGAQERALALLNCDTNRRWSAPGFQGIPEGLRYSGAPYETLLPSSFLRCDAVGMPDPVSEADTTVGMADSLVSALSWSPTSVVVDFHTFGVATVEAIYEVTARRDIGSRALRQIVDDVARRSAVGYKRVLGEVTEVFAGALRETCAHLLRRPWIDPPATVGGHVGRKSFLRRRRREPSTGDKGNLGGQVAEGGVGLLWLHRVYLLDRTQLRDPDAWQGLLPFLHQRHDYAGVTYVPGTEISVLLVDPDPGLARHSPDVLKVTSLQWAYTAAMTEIDRTLHGRLRRLRSRPNDPAPLEQELEAVVQMQEEVRLFQSRYNSLLADLGGGIIVQWEALSGVQQLPQLVASVEDKLSALREACTFRLNDLAAKRERRLNTTVAIFTVFTVIGSLATVAAYLFGEPTKFDVLRALWVAAVTFTVVLVAIASRQTVTRR